MRREKKIISIEIASLVKVPDIIPEEKEVLPEGVPEPAVLITNDEGIPEEPAWTYRYLIPTSVAIATIIILGNVIQYFRKVVKKRYKIVEEKKN